MTVGFTTGGLRYHSVSAWALAGGTPPIGIPPIGGTTIPTHIGVILIGITDIIPIGRADIIIHITGQGKVQPGIQHIHAIHAEIQPLPRHHGMTVVCRQQPTTVRPHLQLFVQQTRMVLPRVRLIR